MGKWDFKIDEQRNKDIFLNPIARKTSHDEFDYRSREYGCWCKCMWGRDEVRELITWSELVSVGIRICPRGPTHRTFSKAFEETQLVSSSAGDTDQREKEQKGGKKREKRYISIKAVPLTKSWTRLQRKVCRAGEELKNVYWVCITDGRSWSRSGGRTTQFERPLLRTAARTSWNHLKSKQREREKEKNYLKKLFEKLI